jgi:protein prenyltransferase alpha subunit repeat containing protein 1
MQQVPAMKEKLEERIYSMSMGRLEDVLGGACRPQKKRLWMSMLGFAVNS